jgi:hypothetical protein
MSKSFEKGILAFNCTCTFHVRLSKCQVNVKVRILCMCNRGVDHPKKDNQT